MDAPVLLGVSVDWPDVPPPLWVREAHRRAVNLEDPRGRRFSLVTDPRDLGPRTAWLSHLPELREGEPGPDLPRGEEGLRFDPRIRPGRPRPRWRPLWEEWPVFLEDPELRALGEALREEDPLSLAGLGPGHTPAGDDWIAGWLVALGWIGSPESLRARGELGRRFDPGRTAWLAGEVIRDALEGLAWARPAALTAALEGEDGEAVLRAISAMTDWGHTSGRAWLAGFAGALGRFDATAPR